MSKNQPAYLRPSYCNRTAATSRDMPDTLTLSSLLGILEWDAVRRLQTRHKIKADFENGSAASIGDEYLPLGPVIDFL